MTNRALLTISLFTFALACGDSGSGGAGTGAGGSGGNGGGGAATTGGAGPGGGNGDACEEFIEAFAAKCEECPGLCEGGGGTGGTGGAGGAGECTAEDEAVAGCYQPCYEEASCDALEGVPGADFDAFIACITPCGE